MKSRQLRSRARCEMDALMQQSVTLLGDLVDGLTADQAAVPVAGIALDSRQLRPGEVFLAVAGHVNDGRDFIDAAVARGAAAIIAEAPCDASQWRLPVVVVDRLGERVSEIAGRFYQHPSRRLKVIGVTGTNGKSSVTHYIAQMLDALAQPCGVIGTLGAGRVNQLSGALNTTPDAISIQSTLGQWRDAGAKWAAMEVSSHGLSQHRVAALQFSTAVFTNLSQDHLDYHGTMAEYGAAKARLFTMSGLQHAVLNADDLFTEELRKVCASPSLLTFGLSADADVCASEIKYLAEGISARIQTPWGELQLFTALIGIVNLKNVLAAIAVLGVEGFSVEQIEQALKVLKPVPGRLEKLQSVGGVQVIIDYAHSPDALEQVLTSLRPHCQRRLWCVFGCGGNRDKSKRPLMAAVAERLADVLIVTTDNPRDEAPEVIAGDIRKGLTKDGYRIELDRQRAIELAVGEASAGDLIVIAGKGHEDYQEWRGQRLPFSDVHCARLALAGRQSS